MARQQQRGGSSSASNGSASASGSGTHSRTDRRFKDQAAAPAIVSEKRLTFFLPEETFRTLRFQTGFFQVANSQQSEEGVEELPETPSALVREAINFWLDQFRGPGEQSRSEREWKQRIGLLRATLERFGGAVSAAAGEPTKGGGKKRARPVG